MRPQFQRPEPGAVVNAEPAKVNDERARSGETPSLISSKVRNAGQFFTRPQSRASHRASLLQVAAASSSSSRGRRNSISQTHRIEIS
jgi:hypothetical protein